MREMQWQIAGFSAEPFQVTCHRLLLPPPLTSPEPLANWKTYLLSGILNRSVDLRRGLFMTDRVFNDRLLENGRKPEQISIAVMRELLHQIYRILKSSLPCNPEKRGFPNAV